ncbi:MAG: GIY-YIG nuclease family protein [Hyphomonadaceae bacterium]|nr:GIY-YIG nuclease family protein [Hyphomonadaceae bacterium]
MTKEFTEEDAALLAELGIGVESKKELAHTPREERIMGGFEEIQHFAAKHGRVPQHSEVRDVFERLHAARLERLRTLEQSRELIGSLDDAGLLEGAAPESSTRTEQLDDDALLAELGVKAGDMPVTELRHVRSAADKKAARDVARRDICEDFETFRPLFEQVQRELDTGIRETRSFERKAEIERGRFFIVGGQKAYVAGRGEDFLTDQGMVDARLRVIFDNGTESNMLMRSLQRALHKDEAGRRITEPTAGPLFSDRIIDGNEASGTIYVLRSRSDHPQVAANRELVHKIGVTHMDVEKRISGAHLQPTFLMAGVRIVATYQLYNIDRTKLENLIHRIFEPARLEIGIKDRFGRTVVPREWFLVPLHVIDEAVARIRNGTIRNVRYDPGQAALVGV